MSQVHNMTQPSQVAVVLERFGLPVIEHVTNLPIGEGRTLTYCFHCRHEVLLVPGQTHCTCSNRIGSKP